MSEWFARYFYAPASGHRIAAFRILFGLYLLGYLGALLPHVPLLFSNEGVFIPYLVPDYAPGPAVAWALFASMLVFATALVLGYRAELAARLLLLLFLYHYFLQIAVKQSSFDRLIAIGLIILSFADAGRVFGLDARHKGRPQPCVWPERLLALQTSLLYFGSGLWKAFNPAWHSGTLLRSTLQGTWASPLAFAIVQRGFSNAAWTRFSQGVICFELLLAPLLLMRRTRALGLALGAGFHLFNTVVLVIPEFLVVPTTYAVFVEPATIERVGRRCTDLTRILGHRWRRLSRRQSNPG